MSGLKKDEYDVIIIGAGIGGLVCGCYLAKAGMKVLIVEKNDKPGGYCTSFRRKEFIFDACAHTLGDLRNDGNVAKVLKDLEINNKINIDRYDPSDIVITPDYKISFFSELDKTISELQINFPKEKNNLRKFFEYLYNSNALVATKLRKRTFKELLDSFLFSEKLKSIFSLFVLGNLSLPASLISAFTAVKFYKQFILDGGYYPRDGMQALPNILSVKFNEFGGKLLLNSFVKKIEVRTGEIKGIVLASGNFISSKYVVSNCDARQTFIALIGMAMLKKAVINKLYQLIPSFSMCVLYLGLKEEVNNFLYAGSNMWRLPNYNIEEMYLATKKGRIENSGWYMVRVLPNRKSILAYRHAPFKSISFWNKNKSCLMKEFINKVQFMIPNVSNQIIIEDMATPQTLFKWTLNYKGATYGWAPMPSQFMIQDLYKPSFIKNLYLVGHWTTLAQGIPGVTYLGYKTARNILKKRSN